MEKICVICEELLKEGDDIEVLIRSKWHIIKSKVSYAIDKDEMEAVPGTLAHVECTQEEDYHYDVSN